MTRDEARALNRLLNPAVVGTNSFLSDVYVDEVERGTSHWDDVELDVGLTVLSGTLSLYKSELFEVKL